MKILFLGDTHANIKLVNQAVNVSKNTKIDLIIQVGDFGYFPNLIPTFLEQFNSSVPFYFIDGNHEDHLSLKAYQELDTPIEVKDNLFYCPRGIIHKIEGYNFLFMGGATSIDWRVRTPGVDYFTEENISQGQLMRCQSRLSNYSKIDVMVTHESPYLPPGIKPFEGTERDSNKLAIKLLYEEVKPSLLVHGHYHTRYHKLYPSGIIQGLGADYSDNQLTMTL